jgi:Flp pilus assembly protein TadD
LAASFEVAKGQLDEDHEHPESSSAAYRAALRWDPSSPDANFNLVRALAKAGDVSGALAQSKAAARYVNEPELYILRSRILQNADRKNEARRELEEALQHFPYSEELRREIASLPLPGAEAERR